jgi:hypothetical protein
MVTDDEDDPSSEDDDEEPSAEQLAAEIRKERMLDLPRYAMEVEKRLKSPNQTNVQGEHRTNHEKARHGQPRLAGAVTPKKGCPDPPGSCTL